MRFLRRSPLKTLVLALLLLTGVLIAPRLAALAASPATTSLEANDGGAHIRFSADRRTVLFAESCLNVDWQVEGVRTVTVNGEPVIGQGAQTVCAGSPRLRISLQDGAFHEYRLPREIALTTPYRALIVSSALLLLVAFIPWRLPRFARPFAARLRAWLAAESKAVLVAVLLLTVLAAALRLIHLNGSAKQDEIVTFNDYASKSTWDAISLYYSTNNHVFHTLLMNLAYKLLGNQPWVLRLPVFFAGVLLVPATYAAGRVLYRSSAGLLAAAFVAASSLLTVFSTYGRGYMLQCLFAVLMLGLGAYLLRNRDRFGWSLYALCGTLGFYTSATLIYPFAIISLWMGGSLLLNAPRGERLRALVPWLAANAGAGLAAALLHVPVFAVSGIQAFFANEYVVPLTLAEFTESLSRRLVSAWNGSMLDIPAFLVIALLIGFVTSIVLSRRVSRFALPLGLCALLVMPVIMLVLRVPIYQRVMLPLLPLFFITACGGLAGFLRLESRLTALAAPLLALALMGIVLINGSVHDARHYDMGAFPEAATAVTDLRSRLEPGDVVITHRRSAVMRYYFDLLDIGREYVTVPDEPSSARRIFVLGPYPSQPAEKILDEFDFDPRDFNTPVLLQHYGGYALYLVTNPAFAVQST